MPKLYEYLGLVIFFYSNEHEPVHVHGRYGDCESKAEFYIENGEIREIVIKSVKGAKPLKGDELKNFKKLLEVYAEDIVKKWVDYFVLNRNFKVERISKRLR